MAVLGNQSFTIADWHVEPTLNRVSRRTEFVKVDPQNMKVLELLASRPGEVISPMEIEQIAWAGLMVTPNSVYQSIAHLRKALGDDKNNPKYIETIARRGYRCIAPIGRVSPSKVVPEADAELRTKKPPLKAIVLIFAVATSVSYLLWLSHDRSVLDMQSTSSLTARPSSKLSRMQTALDLGDAAVAARKPKDAMRHYALALEEAENLSGNMPSTMVAEALTGLAMINLFEGAIGEARMQIEKALAHLRDSAPPMHPHFVDAYCMAAEVARVSRRHGEADEYLREASALAEQLTVQPTFRR